MSRLRNPIYASGVMEKYIYLDTPDTAQRLNALSAELAKAVESANRIPEMREVIKEVQVESPELLNRLNDAMRELGTIKREMGNKAAIHLTMSNQARMEPAPPVVVESVKKTADIIRIVKQETFNTRAMLYTIALSFLAGMACLSLLRM